MNHEQPQIIAARVVPGHQVASGHNGDPRFPGGTLRMQLPYFRQRGFDLGHFYQGTLNVSVAPLQYRVVAPKCTFKNLRWHPTAPPEDFSFFDVRVLRLRAMPLAGFIYYPHPETKPEHFQAPDVLELLLPFVSGITYGVELTLEIPVTQMAFEMPSAQPRRTGSEVRAGNLEGIPQATRKPRVK